MSSSTNPADQELRGAAMAAASPSMGMVWSGWAEVGCASVLFFFLAAMVRGVQLVWGLSRFVFGFPESGVHIRPIVFGAPG